MHRKLLLLVPLALAAFAAVLSGSAASAAPACKVVNTGTKASFNTLQAAVTAATAGNTLKVSGICVGSTTISKNLNVVGASATLDGTGTGTSVVTVSKGVTATLTGLTITGGNVDFFSSSEAGGIENRGTLTLNNASVTGNTSPNGGGIRNEFGSTLTVTNSSVNGNTDPQSGGGIVNDGTLTVTNSSVNDNVGAGLSNRGTATLTGSTVNKNHGDDGGGGYGANGGISNTGPLTLINSTVNQNFGAGGYAGGILNRGATVTLTNSTVNGNVVFGRGGGISNCSAACGYGAASTVVLINSTMNNNTATGLGGGIYNDSTVTLTGSNVNSNSALDGGGIYNALGTTIAAGSDSLSLAVSTSINVASTVGFPASGTLTVVSTAGPETVTYTNRTSTSFDGTFGGVGVLSTGGLVVGFGAVTLTSSTVTGNTPNNCQYVIGC